MKAMKVTEWLNISFQSCKFQFFSLQVKCKIYNMKSFYNQIKFIKFKIITL